MKESAADRQTVRDLASRLAEVAADPSQQKKMEEWRRHNSLKPGRPLVLQDPEGVWDEFVPVDSLLCTAEMPKAIERQLRMKLYKADHLRDDEPLTTTLPVHLHIAQKGWTSADLTVPEEEGVWGAVRYNTVLTPESDIDELLPFRTITFDRESSDRYYQEICDLVGDILEVKQVGINHPGMSPTDAMATIRGIETFMMDMIERPDWVHRVLDRMLQIDLDILEQYEALNVLSLNNGIDRIGSGGVGLTDELPAPGFDGEHVRPCDMWGFVAAQIFSEVSPAMHEEFGLRHEIPYLEKFGLNYYGCCEPLHLKVGILKNVPRLRRISMSPWIDPVKAAEEIGDQFIYSYKPNPAYLASGVWDLEVCRKEMRTVLDAAKRNNSTVEFIMKDTHTCRGEPERYDQWTEMALELAHQYA